MEHQTAEPKKTILNYGVLLGLVNVFLAVISYVLDMHLNPHWAFVVIGILIFIGFIVYGLKAFKKENGGFLALGEALKVGMGISLIAALIGVVWFLILSSVIEPDYYEQLSDFQREIMIEKFPEMGDEQLDKAMEINSKFNSPWITSAISIITTLFIGFLISLFAGLAMRVKRPYDV